MKMKPATLALLPLLATLAIPTGIAPTCTPDHVWFLGIVDDLPDKREDFGLDVLNFEFFLDELNEVYCIPDTQSEILAFDGSFQVGATTYSNYEEASEENLKAHLASFGTAASAHSDSLFFYFHSSHGLAYATPLTTCPLARWAGSYAALHSDGGGDDGFLDDCELGAELTGNFDPDVDMFVAVDCSLCGGFSDSLTAVSGTITDDSLSTSPPTSSGVPKANRIVVTGCAITTECFGGGYNDGGAHLYDAMHEVLDRINLFGVSVCDGWTAPGFPAVQGFDVPLPIGATDGECDASEWFFASVLQTYVWADYIGIQQQYRIKYGMANMTEDIPIQ